MALYNHYKELNKDVLLQDEDFVTDATAFLIDRGGYTPDELSDDKKVYDAYMEHFRYQNVNEVTALKDLNYAQDTDDEGRARMGRLMDTFDKMDSDFGLTAAQDYLGGVFTAPSTYAGMFSFGTGKAAALAANQGIKIGIRQALKYGMRSAAASAAIDAPIAAGTALAQEEARVQTGIKEEIDMTNVALAGGLSLAASGGIGLATGTKRALSAGAAEEIAQNTLLQHKKLVQKGNKLAVKTLTDPKTSKVGKQFLSAVKESIETDVAEAAKAKGPRKAALIETIPEELVQGGKIRLEKINSNAKTVEQMEIENIAAAATRLDDFIGTGGGIGPKGKIERFTSRLVRALGTADKDTIAGFDKILKEHNLTFQQLGPLFAAEISRAASLMGTVSAAARKSSFRENMEMLNAMDDGLLRSGLDVIDGEGRALSTKVARERLSAAEQEHLGAFTKSANVISSLNKARVGLMTVQASTTVRNTTNGYMRNYVYALDNLGASLVNFIPAGAKFVAGATIGDDALKAAAKNDVRLGVAQLRTGWQAARLKDMVLGTSSTDTQALFRMLGDRKFGSNKVVQKLLREMGDVADITGTEGGLLGLARKLNTFNTMSDNMFKRAIFSREVNKALIANPIKGVDAQGRTITINSLDQAMRTGNFKAIDNKVFSDAMDAAFDFTYQTGGYRGREGAFNTFADFLIRFGSSTVGSTAIPFPRYMVNQFRFFYEHAPVFGSLNLGGILNKSGKKGVQPLIAVNQETLGKQLSGLAMIGAFAGLRANYGDETTGAYEYIDPTTGSPLDARASIGPFSGYALIADLLYRYQGRFNIPVWHDNKKVTTVKGWDVRELVQAFTGGQGRAGVGLDIVDGVVNAALESDAAGLEGEAAKETVARYLGNVMGTFIVGAGMLKDVVSTLDPAYRQLPDNTDVNMYEYMLKQATKSLPIAPDEDRPMLASPTRSSGVRRFNPFMKQITGLSPLERRTVVENELKRMQFDYAEISPSKIRLDAPMTNEARQEMGKSVESDVFAYITSNAYKKEPSDKLKRLNLKKAINHFKGLARAKILNPDRAENDEQLMRIYRAKFNNMSKDQRVELNEIYKTVYPEGDGIVEDAAYWFIDEAKVKRGLQ